MADALWITEQDVVQLMNLKEAIGALEAALVEEARGEALNMTKTLMQFQVKSEGTGFPVAGGNLHAIGGKLGAIVGTKTWAHTEGGTSPLLLLWGAGDGQPVAIIEAFALGNMRTGGISGVAANWMAKPDAKVMAIAGSGKQSLSQVATMLAVRPIERLQVFSPTAASRASFVAKAREEFKIDVVDCASIEDACKGADIVTLVTRATEPFVKARMLERGTHLNAVGAIALDREEFAQDVFERATLLAVDNLPGVQSLSREFASCFEGKDWESVWPLSKLIEAERRRAEDDDVSIFKAMGMGLSDLALGVELVRRARAKGVGRVIPQPKKAKPRLV